MKKWKILSLLLSLCLLIGLLPTAALAADQTNDGAGIRIVQGDAYDSSTGIFSIKVQAKLPVGTGISSVGTLLSYDNTKLAVVNKNNTSKDVTSNEGVKKESEAIISKTLIQTVDDDENTKEYTLQDSAMYKAGDRSGIYTFHYNGKPLTQNATDAQTSGNWFDVYEVMFRVAGKPADPATVLNSDSLRIADVAKGDAAVMKGAFPANNIYSIYLTDNSNPARLYVLNRMSECTETEVTGEKSLMTAPETGTATYPGSTNPVTPPASATLTGIKVKTAPTKVIYTEGESFDKTGMVIEATYSDSTKKDVAGYSNAEIQAGMNTGFAQAILRIGKVVRYSRFRAKNLKKPSAASTISSSIRASPFWSRCSKPSRRSVIADCSGVRTSFPSTKKYLNSPVRIKRWPSSSKTASLILTFLYPKATS